MRSGLVNLVPSLLWTVIFVGPVYVFSAHQLSLGAIYSFAAAGGACMFLPRVLMRTLELSSAPRVYRMLRVSLLIQFTQDAPWLRRLGGSSEGRARIDRRSLTRIERDTVMRERFHLGLFVFYFLCSIAALVHGQALWCVALVATNIIYNVYPMWLQQYLRLRVSRCLARMCEPRTRRRRVEVTE